jgi:glycosyltransferase involved in cell wall biosynthesis
MRRAFLLSGANRFKALDAECSALGPPARRGAKRVSNREALDRLNAVGACFLEGPIYSDRVFAGDSDCPAGLLQQLFDAIRARHPLLLYKVGTSPQSACKRLAPSDSIAISQRSLDEGVQGVEEDALRTSLSAEPTFPVIVLALGVAGRLLAARLMLRGFPGFILDLDDLAEIPFEQEPGARRFSPLRLVRRPLTPKLPGRLDAREGLPLHWTGPFLGQFSFSIINRELCSRLAADKRIDLSIEPSDVPFAVQPIRGEEYAGFRAIVDRVGKKLGGPARMHVQHHVQHPYRAPADGHWVVIQPWDYVSLPVRWADWIHTQVDEVWTPSSFVRNAYLEAGIPPERVAVVVNGVDVRLYRPNASKVKLNTKKRFKFLFVGGPFWRKGFDVLLAAYGRAFGRSDDVSLVVKSVPDFWTSAGSKQVADFRAGSGAPEVLSIVQSIEPKRMAGLYAACDCLVHPYRAEGFAMCVAEGMASGLPAIVTGVGGTRDYCTEQTAFLLPAAMRQMERKQLDNEPTLDYPSYAEPEVDALVEAMRCVYDKRQDANRIARAGMEKIRAEFTWDRAAEQAVQRLTGLQSRPIVRREAA